MSASKVTVTSHIPGANGLPDQPVSFEVPAGSLDQFVDGFEQARDNLTAIYHARIAAGAIWPWLERVEAWPRLLP